MSSSPDSLADRSKTARHKQRRYWQEKARVTVDAPKRSRSGANDAARRAHIRRREKLAALKAKPCADCGGTFHPYVMDFDHREGTVKRFQISAALAMKIPERDVLAEIAKCDLVCSNCHRMRTLARFESTRLPPPPPARGLKTHCPKGHAYDDANARRRYDKSGAPKGRRCMACEKDGSVRRARARAEAEGREYKPTGPKPRLAGRTQCVRGHDYNNANTYVRERNGRVEKSCRVCARLADRDAKRGFGASR